MLWSQKIDVVDMDSKKTMDVCSRLVVFGRYGLDRWRRFWCWIGCWGTKGGVSFSTRGRARKNVRQNWRSKLKAKNGTKRVAVRALNFSTRPFCMKFQGGSNRDGPECHNPQKWTKNAKKLLHENIALKIKNRVDVKKKNGRVWVFPRTFLHHQILQIVQNFHTDPAVIGVNSITHRKLPK